MPVEVLPSNTQPHKVVDEGISVPKAWALRAVAGALAVLLGAGTHALATADTGLATDVASLHGRVDQVSADVAAARASGEEARSRLARLEARADRFDSDLRKHERLMITALEVTVVGLRHISEGLAELESRGGRARPMPPELQRGLADLQLDLHSLKRGAP